MSLKRIKVSLTSNDILNIGSSPFILIPAGGPNTLIDTPSIIMKYNFGTIPYQVSTANLILIFGVVQASDAGNQYSTSSNSSIGLSSNKIFKFSGPSLNAPPVNMMPINQALRLTTLGNENPINGNGTADFYITYRILHL